MAIIIRQNDKGGFDAHLDGDISQNEAEEMKSAALAFRDSISPANLMKEAIENAKKMELERQFKASQEHFRFIAEMPKRHEEMLVRAQLEALRRFEAEKQTAKATQQQAEEVGDIGEPGAVLAGGTKDQATEGDIYPRREIEFELLNIDHNLSLKDIYALVIATGNEVWHKQKQAKGKASEFINQNSFDSEFYSVYCEEKGIIRKRGAPPKPK